MEPEAAEASPEFDARHLVAGASLLAATANVIMQLARPEVGYAVVESTVGSEPACSGSVIEKPDRIFASSSGRSQRSLCASLP